MPNAQFINMTTSAAATRFTTNSGNNSTYGPSTGRIGPNDISASGYVNPTIVGNGLVEPSQYVSASDVVTGKAYPGFEVDGATFI